MVADWRRLACADGLPVATLTEALQAAADTARGVTFIDERGGEARSTYASLWSDARRVAAGLRAVGLEAGERVLVVLPTGPEFVHAFFGVLIAGGVPVPGYPPAAMERAALAVERLAHLRGDCGARLLLTDRELRPLLLGLVLRGVARVLAVEELREADPSAVPALDARSTAFIQYTSGSTSAPKGVVLTHRAVLSNALALGQRVAIRADDVGVSWLPLYHDMGLVTMLLSAVAWQVELVLMGPHVFLLDPLAWLRAVDRHRGTISVSPTFGFARCLARARNHPPVDLSSWRAVIASAEPIDPAVMADFAARFAPWGLRAEALGAAYGLAECTAAVSFSWGDGLRTRTLSRDALAAGRIVPEADGVSLVELGAALPGFELRVVDDEDQPLPEGQLGAVQVRGPSALACYHGQPALTAETVAADGWVRSGDRGFVVDGALVLCGRDKEILILRGRKHDPVDLERAAEAVAGVRKGGVVVFAVTDPAGADRVVLVAECRAPDAALPDALRAAVLDATGVRLDDLVLGPPGLIPKTSSGKRQRLEARRRWLAGTLVPSDRRWRDLARVAGGSLLGGLVERFTVGASRRLPPYP